MEVRGTDPAVFVHVRMVISMVVSLGMARLISGVARFVRHSGRHSPYGVHLLWTLSLLLSMTHFWWWEFALTHVPVWRFEMFLFVVAYAALYYLICAVLYPDDMGDYGGYRDYFIGCRRWFFGLLAAVYLADVVDTWIKGEGYLAALGWEYGVRAAAYVVLCLVAAITPNLRFHAVFAVVNLVYQVTWILRVYDVMGN